MAVICSLLICTVAVTSKLLDCTAAIITCVNAIFSSPLILVQLHCFVYVLWVCNSSTCLVQICGEANVGVIREAAMAGVPRCAFVSVHDYKFPGMRMLSQTAPGCCAQHVLLYTQHINPTVCTKVPLLLRFDCKHGAIDACTVMPACLRTLQLC